MSLSYCSERLIKYGSYVDIYEYERPVLRGYSVSPSSPSSPISTPSQKRSDNLFRSRTMIRRLVNGNSYLNKFITLTFAPKCNKSDHKKHGLIFQYVDDPTNFDETNYHFKKFRQKLCYKYGYNSFPYLCVPEFQKNGNLHYHVLADLPYVPVESLSSLWSAGFVKINELSTVSNVGAYVSKYLTKQSSLFYDNANKKSFFHSLDLKRPLEVTRSSIGGMSLKVEKTFRYLSEYYGNVSLSINKIVEV